MKLYAGIDIGSTTGKAALLDAEQNLLGTCIIPATERPEKTARLCLDQLLDSLDLDMLQIAFVTGTGYGRVRIPFANDNVSEITCHATGAKWLCPTIKTVIDIGGQDCKVMAVLPNGRVSDFAMNDKCAAGTGRFMDGQARAMGVRIDEFSDLSQAATAPARVSAQCSVFAESEVIALINGGTEVSDIVAGIHESIASRLVGLLKRIESLPDVTVTGGCAKNKGLISSLQDMSGLSIVQLQGDPQTVGAIGAAVLAHEQAGLASKGTARLLAVPSGANAI